MAQTCVYQAKVTLSVLIKEFFHGRGKTMGIFLAKLKKCGYCGQEDKLGSIHWKPMGSVRGKRFFQCTCGAGMLVGLTSTQQYDPLETRLIIEHIITASGSIT